MVQGGLRRAVPAPSGVVLDGRIGAEAEQDPVRGAQVRKQAPRQGVGCAGVGLPDRGEALGLEVLERGHRERSQRAGVVHEQVETAAVSEAAYGVHQVLAVRRVGDVAGQRGHAVEVVGRLGEPGGVPAVGDDGPAAVVEGADQGTTEAGGAAGDEGERCVFTSHAVESATSSSLEIKGRPLLEPPSACDALIGRRRWPRWTTSSGWCVARGCRSACARHASCGSWTRSTSRAPSPSSPPGRRPTRRRSPGCSGCWWTWGCSPWSTTATPPRRGDGCCGSGIRVASATWP